MRITFLGTGTSHGIPMITCSCRVCRSRSPKNKRLRPSVLIELDNGKNILIDTSPDLRQQSITHKIKHIDAVLFTHDHNDHINGLDDLRGFTERNKKTIPCFGTRQTIKSAKDRFSYAFKTPAPGLTVPKINLKVIDKPLSIFDTEIIPLPVMHGKLPILGYRIGSFAYITDVKTIPAKTHKLLSALDTLVIDALRHRPHPTHMCLKESLDAIGKIAPKKALLTHICHELEHRELCRSLPPHIRPAHDGLVINL